MTQNLRLSDKVITSADSDLNNIENFTIPASTTNFKAGENVNNVHIDQTFGGYYSRKTVTAGDTTYNNSSYSAPNSICPKGWKMPTDEVFNTLITKYNYSTLSNPPAKFVLSGRCYPSYSTCPHQHNQFGWYWVSNASPINNNYFFLFYESGMYMSNADDAKHGYAVRCIYA